MGTMSRQKKFYSIPFCRKAFVRKSYTHSSPRPKCLSLEAELSLHSPETAMWRLEGTGLYKAIAFTNTTLPTRVGVLILTIIQLLIRFLQRSLLGQKLFYWKIEWPCWPCWPCWDIKETSQSENIYHSQRAHYGFISPFCWHCHTYPTGVIGTIASLKTLPP